MSEWYICRKRINGRVYVYRQRSWRENGKVKSESIYLGPVEYAEFNEEDKGNPFREPIGIINPNDHQQAEHSSSIATEPPDFGGPLEVVSAPAPTPSNPYNPTPQMKASDRLLEATDDLKNIEHLKGFNISDLALRKEWLSYKKHLDKLGLELPEGFNLTFKRSRKLGHKFKRDGTLVILLPKDKNSGRNIVRTEIRKAMASLLLERFSKQQPGAHQVLKNQFSTGYWPAKIALFSHVLKTGSHKSIASVAFSIAISCKLPRLKSQKKREKKQPRILAFIAVQVQRAITRCIFSQR